MSIIPAIYTYENSEIVSRLIELAGNKALDKDTCFYAIIALGKVKAIKAIPFLQNVVEEEEELDYFRSAACRSISKIQKSQKK
ncbi:MAG: HEAT repeat domain-containing protein [Candidatus Scalinduaceae bacterium]